MVLLAREDLKVILLKEKEKMMCRDRSHKGNIIGGGAVMCAVCGEFRGCDRCGNEAFHYFQDMYLCLGCIIKLKPSKGAVPNHIHVRCSACGRCFSAEEIQSLNAGGTQYDWCKSCVTQISIALRADQ